MYLEADVINSRAFRVLTATAIRTLLRFYQLRWMKTERGRKGKKAYVILNNGEIVFTYADATKFLGIPDPPS